MLDNPILTKFDERKMQRVIPARIEKRLRFKLEDIGFILVKSDPRFKNNKTKSIEITRSITMVILPSFKICPSKFNH